MATNKAHFEVLDLFEDLPAVFFSLSSSCIPLAYYSFLLVNGKRFLAEEPASSHVLCSTSQNRDVLVMNNTMSDLAFFKNLYLYCSMDFELHILHSKCCHCILQCAPAVCSIASRLYSLHSFPLILKACFLTTTP